MIVETASLGTFEDAVANKHWARIKTFLLKDPHIYVSEVIPHILQSIDEEDPQNFYSYIKIIGHHSLERHVVLEGSGLFQGILWRSKDEQCVLMFQHLCENLSAAKIILNRNPVNIARNILTEISIDKNELRDKEIGKIFNAFLDAISDTLQNDSSIAQQIAKSCIYKNQPQLLNSVMQCVVSPNNTYISDLTIEAIISQKPDVIEILYQHERFKQDFIFVQEFFQSDARYSKNYEHRQEILQHFYAIEARLQKERLQHSLSGTDQVATRKAKI